MPEEIVGKFEVKMLRILDEEGNCDEALKPTFLTMKLRKSMN